MDKASVPGSSWTVGHASASGPRSSWTVGHASAVPQRAGKGSTSAALQPVAGTVEVNIGTFNVGTDQTKLRSKKCAEKIMPNLRRVINICVDLGDLHLLNLCELGGHRQGLNQAKLEMDTVTMAAMGLAKSGIGQCSDWPNVRWNKSGIGQVWDWPKSGIGQL